MNDAGDGIGRRVIDSYPVVGGRTAGGVLSHIFFICAFAFCSLMSCLFLSEQSMIAVVSVSLFIISFLCLRSL